MDGLKAALSELERDFVLEAELGRGGMGVVFRVTERETGRPLALKLILSAKPGGEDLARFEREGELTARLRHPNVVRVHRRGQAAGLPWLAYELVEGARPLSDAMAERDLAGRVALVRDAAAALGEAHALGIVHRDVKAANLLVDAEGRVRVTDFGVAAASDLDRLTQTGAMVGTPTHVAPEQLRGGTPSPRFDVWALGVVLYRGLTGELPFDGNNLLELVAQIDRGEPPPPRRRDSSIPPDLEAVCLKALERDPSARYADAAELAADLGRWLEGEDVTARPRQPWRRGARALVWAGPPAVAVGLLVVVVARSSQPVPVASTAPAPSATATATATPSAAPTSTAAAHDPGEVPLTALRVPERDHPMVSGLAERALRRDREAMLELGRTYRSGQRGVRVDLSASEGWYRAAAEAGSGKGWVRLGEVRLERGNRVGAYEAWREVLKRGLPEAREGAILAAELAWSERQPSEAVRWLGAAYRFGNLRRANNRVNQWFGRWSRSELEALAPRVPDGPGVGDACLALAHVAGRARWDQAEAARRARLAWLRRGLKAGHLACALQLSNATDSSGERVAVAWLARKRSEAGDADGTYVLAELTLKGRGVKRDPAAAMRLFERAAPRYAPAATVLGERWRDGKAGRVDLQAAAGWFRMAAERGDEEGTRALIALLAAGRVDEAEPGEAKRWLGALADRGEGWAARALPKEPPARTHLVLAKAAEAGEAGARVSAADAFLKPTRARDVLRAVALLRADGSAASWLRLVEVFRRDLRDSSQERFLLQRAIAAGSAAARGRLAALIERRLRTPADRDRAERLLREAHAGGWKPALARLGALLGQGGPGRAPDPAAAAAVFEQGAQGGDLDCMLGLGRLLLRGRGVPADAERAGRLFSQVAEAGDARGHMWLGRLYGGLGPKPDPERAERHLRQGAESGAAGAISALGQWLLSQGRTREGLRRLRQSADRGYEPAREILRRRAAGSK